MFRLDSDFTDFYDKLTNNKSRLKYIRKRVTFGTRIKELSFLNSLGIKTIPYGIVSKLDESIKDNDKIVVYTNQSMHSSTGKHIYRRREAAGQYRNLVASKYIPNNLGYTLKYLQIGERRFQIILTSTKELNEGTPIYIQELEPRYNNKIKLPIFSIDYVTDGNDWFAVDFNEVQRLDNLNIEDYIKAEDVVLEIKKALQRQKNENN